jgi:hypothetical protein
MKKHFILLSLKTPDFSRGELKPHAWKEILSSLVLKAKNDSKIGVIILAESDYEVTLLIPRNESGLVFVADCIYRVQNYGKCFKSWFLDESE